VSKIALGIPAGVQLIFVEQMNFLLKGGTDSALWVLSFKKYFSV
jgi:hypothetical protein